jgi:hypothetical protein
MRGHRLVQIIISILLVCSAFFVCPVSAAPTPDSMAEATLTCTFESGAHVIVQTSMIVKSINVFDTVYDREAIEAMASTNQYVMGAIMLRLHESVKAQLETAVPQAEVDATSVMPAYENPYFIDDFQVNLTAGFFQYNGSLNLAEFIPGALDMGATVTYHCNLQATKGWNTTYVYVLPSEMTLAYANTADTDPDNNKVTWTVRNWDGNDPGDAAILSVQSKNPTTTASGAENIVLEFSLDTRTVNDISIVESVLLKKVNVDRYNVLPGFITGLESIPADGVRLCIDNGLFSWEDLFVNTIQPIEQQTTPLVENSSFGQNLSLSFRWDPDSTMNCSIPYNITSMNDSPAIRADFTDSTVQLLICQMPARAFFGLINAGAAASISSADVNFGRGLEAIRYPYDIVLRLPANITLNEDNVYTWNKTTPVAGEFTSDVQPVPPYSAERVETRIEVELQKMDLNIPSVFTGKTELTASAKLKEDDRLYVVRLGSDLYFSPKVNLTYLNADAFRLCAEENVFDESQINAFLTQKTQVFEERLSNLFKGVSVNGAVDRKVFTNSLAWDGDISAMDDVVPVVVSNIANQVYAIGFNMSVWPAELTIAPQRYMLQGLQNQTVTYRIIFPRGITVNASDSAGRPFIIGKTNDGRDYVEVSFDAASSAESSLLTCVLNVSPVYVLGLFLPCLLVFILLIVLVIIIYLIRKKRGGLRRAKRKLFEPEDNEPSEYGGEEYYVPPPPSSTKKKR